MAEAEEMYHTKIYIVPFSVHGGGTGFNVDISGEEFIVDVLKTRRKRFEGNIEAEMLKVHRENHISITQSCFTSNLGLTLQAG